MHVKAAALFHSLPIVGEEALGIGRHFVAINHDEGWIERMLVGNATAFSLDRRALSFPSRALCHRLAGAVVECIEHGSDR